MTDIDVTDPDLIDLIAQFDVFANAYLRGEVRRCLEIFGHADDFTLFPPYGEAIHGADVSDEAIAITSDYFRGGQAALEVHAAHRSGDLAVLALVERQHGVIGDYPDQDLSLRVTMVFRRENGRWLLVHRHADPLAHGIGMDRLVELFRG